MSSWRQKAIDIAPELKNEFEDPDLSPYTVFSEFLSLLQEAHINKDTERLKKIYDYAEWCSKQKEQKLWNSVGVSFYEHLTDNDLLYSQFTKWIKKDIYFVIRGLLERRLNDEKLKHLDKHYGWKTAIKVK